MSSATTFTGGCHCGAVRYKVEADLSQVIECDCSHCSKKGLLLVFSPASAFELTAGEPHLSEYRFNTHKIRHRFCATCGVESFAEGEGPNGPTRAINVRCLDHVDPATLNRIPYDGRSR